MKTTSQSCFYDTKYPAYEQMPRVFCVDFCERRTGAKSSVVVSVDGEQIGDALTDNAHHDDGYRYHDVFHLSYLAVLGWSACMRKLLKKKRKSNSNIDEVEDGARATSVEEGMASFIFNYAEQNNFFEGHSDIDPAFLDLVKLAFSKFEVKDKSCDDWQAAILKGFSVFRQLKHNAGGRVLVDMYNQDLRYISSHKHAF